MENRIPIFREIHKNTWLKRLTPDGRKFSVGNKKNDKYWVVFCVHDDCEALLEGYTETKQAPSHVPEWTISLQKTMHISHALVPSEQDYEFVITTTNDVHRFTTNSWECMKEWVETLRSKLREMKIISPKENVYSKLPEHRMPLLPTRDPMSPLPPPPSTVPDIVPGIEVLPTSTPTTTITSVDEIVESTETEQTQSDQLTIPTTSISSHSLNNDSNSLSSDSPEDEQETDESNCLNSLTTNTPPPLSNTTTKSIMNLLLNPIQVYGEQYNTQKNNSSNAIENHPSTSKNVLNITSNDENNTNKYSLAKIFSDNVLSSDIGTQFDFNINLDDNENDETILNVDDCTTATSESINTLSFTPQLLKIPRPQTSKSDKKSMQRQVSIEHVNTSPSIQLKNHDNTATNITIIQLSNEKVINSDSSICLNVNEENPSKASSSNICVIPSHSLGFTGNNENHVNLVTVVSADSNKSTMVQIQNDTKLFDNKEKYSKSKVESDIHKIKVIPPKLNLSSIRGSNFNSITNITMNIDKNDLNNSGQEYEAVFLTSSPSPSSLSTTQKNLFSPKLSSNTSNPINPINNITTNPTTTTSIINNDNNNTNLNLNNEKMDTKSIIVTGLSRHHSLGSNTSSRPVLINNLIENNTNLPSTSSSSSSYNTNNLISKTNQNESVKYKKTPHIHGGGAALTRGSTELNLNRSRFHKSMHNNQCVKTVNNFQTQQLSNEVRTGIEQLKRDSREQRRRSLSASEAHSTHETRRTSPTNRTQKTHKETHLVNRLTLREQQVMQLRTEMMHPGGIRLQLRKKDCIGSIAWVDAFNSVWIAGWKQKEHPMLYNALHIGDQLISIGSVIINSSADANKIIRSSQSLYIELIIRRVPFGRVYAIRRDMEGQCLGFIRDGNTATIVDVVPNSLAARHGLPPKTKSCDGCSLVCWVLTEINGRPLNLFFKDNEICDRLNSVGRDISILVQPSDLVVKLKKQLKSLRNYKDFIVQ